MKSDITMCSYSSPYQKHAHNRILQQAGLDDSKEGKVNNAVEVIEKIYILTSNKYYVKVYGHISPHDNIFVSVCAIPQILEL